MPQQCMDLCCRSAGSEAGAVSLAVMDHKPIDKSKLVGETGQGGRMVRAEWVGWNGKVMRGAMGADQV